MRKIRLIWQIFPPYLILTLGVVVSVTWFASSSIHEFYLEQTEDELDILARLAIQQIPKPVSSDNIEAIDRFCEKFGDTAAIRLTVVDKSGVVLGDSDEDPLKMENHLKRPEIQAALKEGVGRSTRFSHTVDTEMMYVALDFTDESGNTIAVIRPSISISEIDHVLSGMYQKVLVGALVLAGLAVAISWWISRYITHPLGDLRKGVDRFARGDFDKKLPVPATAEIAELVIAANKMADQLDDRIEMVESQRSELEAVFTSMVEGVIAVDMDYRCLNMNRAASHFLGVSLPKVLGKRIDSFVRNEELFELLNRSMESREVTERDITLVSGVEERIYQVRGTLLHDASRNEIGVLLVFNDVTDLRKLQSLGKEFVANVSHEIKTPITSIRGFTETLLDGAKEDPEDTERFLTIVMKQARRLEAIVEDLLSLSRLDQSDEADTNLLEDCNLEPLVSSCIQGFEQQAAEKSIKIEFQSPPEYWVQANSNLLEQALGNLIDNAIKYSEPDRGIQ
ncbi:MAG: PAS domain-containing protein, partial [Candidatus Omnitrophica bacterium]|nr:PAS domain-containing protein [Candidatus Omnitrophota bacterium]